MKLARNVMLGVVMATSLFAQSEVGERRENQQDRIANGISSGQLTAGETSSLERKEANLNKEIHNDRVANGGNLTNKEKAQINRQQNKLSDQIYDDKHNTAVQHHGNNEVDRRRANQQARIAQGVRSGQLTAGETAKLEHNQAAINHEVHSERVANGGNLTNNEKAQINKQQNHQSARIYNDKHNTAHAHR